jgi:hypothetical protein
MSATFDRERSPEHVITFHTTNLIGNKAEYFYTFVDSEALCKKLRAKQ